VCFGPAGAWLAPWGFGAWPKTSPPLSPHLLGLARNAPASLPSPFGPSPNRLRRSPLAFWAWPNEHRPFSSHLLGLAQNAFAVLPSPFGPGPKRIRRSPPIFCAWPNALPLSPLPFWSGAEPRRDVSFHGRASKISPLGTDRGNWEVIMNQTRFLTALCAAVLPLALAIMANGCSNKDEETPPPQPSAAPTPSPAPTPTAPTPLVVEEDAGTPVDAGDDAADAGKKVVGGGDPTGVRKCCAALAQNANSAPLDQKAGYAAAAAACNGLVNNPSGRQGLAALRGLLRGANMPSSCQ